MTSPTSTQPGVPAADGTAIDPAGPRPAGSGPAGATPTGSDAGEAGEPRLAVRPPSWLDRVLEVAIVGTKAATLACAVDAFVNADTPRLRGKAIRTRAIGYAAGLAVVPTIWRILPDRGRYPRGLDLAVTLPLLIDAVGNAFGLYNEAHLDDVVHFLNGAIVSGVAGALFSTQVDEPWQAALAGTGTAVAGESAWEMLEYLAMKAGADGMDLTYEDTMADMIESGLGAMVGGLVTWLRMPRRSGAKGRGWRFALAGWREAGEPIALVAGRGSARGRSALAAP